MKKFSLILICLLIILSVGTCFALGIDNLSGDFSGEASGETSGEISGESIEDILSEILGEDYFNDEVEVDDVGDNNIMKFGNIVTANGKASDLIMLLGQRIEDRATGSYGFAVGNNLNISGDKEKDVFLAGSSVNVKGNVGRDVYAIGSSIYIDGNISRNVYLLGTEVVIGPYANISGDVLLVGTDSLKIEEGATVLGNVTYDSNVSKVSIPGYINTKIIEKTPLVNDETDNTKALIISTVTWLIANIILFVLTMLIAPKLFEKIKDGYDIKGVGLVFSSLGFGILFLIVVPILVILAIFTVIGISLALVAFFVYILLILYSTVLTGYLVGAIIFKKTNLNKYLVGIIGVVIVQILRSLPIIGGWVAFISILISLGIIVEIARKQKKEE